MTPLLLIATSAISLCVLLAVLASARLFAALDRLLARGARHPYLCVFVVAMLLASLPSLLWSPPVPYVTDEFSYLLSADTLAHGRLTNPTPPLDAHFEFPHVLMRPTYASKYPIGQGVALAVGQVLFHLPIAGVWISSALACVAIVWSLREALPPRWALLGGLLGAMHPLLEWWNNSYWGGSVATLGGALLFGAAIRAIRRPMVRHGIVAGAGIAILAHSRPFEGAICVLITAAAIIWYVRRRVQMFTRFAPGVLIPLVPALAVMGYINYRVTGDPLLHPHLLQQRQYMVGTPFFWQRPNFAQTFRSSAMRAYAWDHDFDEQRQQLGWRNYLYFAFFKARSLIAQFIEPFTLLIAVIAALGIRAPRSRSRTIRAALAVCLLLPLTQLLISPWMRPAYMAPIFAPLTLLVVTGLHRLSRRGAYFGRVVAQAILVTCVATYLAYAKPLSETAHRPAAVARLRLLEDLRRQGGKHLVIVRYPPGFVPQFDFVANGGDLVRDPVIFAREIDSEDDQKLIEAFTDRKPWLLEFDDPGLRVRAWENLSATAPKQ